MKIKLGQGRMTIKQLAEICMGTPVFYGGADENESFLYVVTDSREADADSLFVAAKGERTDGNKYIASASKSGCSCFLCSYVPEDAAICGRKIAALVAKKDETPIKLLCASAEYTTKQNRVRTVAITGSVGKTTTKEMIYSVLSQVYNTHKTEGNHNSIIGMPMSMLAREKSSEISVVEMGMSLPGEISEMSKIASPDIAAITNIGSSHMEFFGTKENILKAKLEITDGMNGRGILLLNADDALLRGVKSGLRQYYVSLYDNTFADAFASDIKVYGDKTVFDATVFGEKLYGLEIPLCGRHNVYAALYAAICGSLLGTDEKQLRAGLAGYEKVEMRQNVVLLKEADITLLEDCYNASPESVRVALDTLGLLKAQSIAGSRAIALLGDMRELGEQSSRLHRETGIYAAEHGTDLLLCFGEEARYIADGAVCAGMKPENVIYFKDSKDFEGIAKHTTELLRAGDVLLVKASRSMTAEKISAKIKELLEP